jgi:hypothetical protein
MEDTALVGMMNRTGDDCDNPSRTSRIGGELGKPLIEAGSVDEFHAEEMPSTVLTNLVDWHDVRMVELRDGLGLILKSQQFTFRGENAGLDQLHGDCPVESHLVGFQDDAHPPSAQLAKDLIAWQTGLVTHREIKVSSQRCLGPSRQRIRGANGRLAILIARAPGACRGQPGVSGLESRIDHIRQVWKLRVVPSSVGLLTIFVAEFELNIQKFPKEPGPGNMRSPGQVRGQFSLSTRSAVGFEAVADCVNHL